MAAYKEHIYLISFHRMIEFNKLSASISSNISKIEGAQTISNFFKTHPSELESFEANKSPFQILRKNEKNESIDMKQNKKIMKKTVKKLQSTQFHNRLNNKENKRIKERQRTVGFQENNLVSHLESILQTQVLNSQSKFQRKYRQSIPQELMTIKSIQINQINEAPSNYHVQSKTERTADRKGSSLAHRAYKKIDHYSKKRISDDSNFNLEEKEKEAAQELFRLVNRKMKAEEEQKCIQTKNSNCFYSKLKRKLENQMKKIEPQSENVMNLIIQGCNIEKHRRKISSNLKPCLSEKQRPKTALARCGLQIRLSENFIDKNHKRVQSARRESSTERKHYEYLKNKPDLPYEPNREPPVEIKTCRSSIFAQQNNLKKNSRKVHARAKSARPNRPDSSCTSREERNSMAYHQKTTESDKIKEKVQSILFQCDNHKNEYTQVKNGMKIFTFYCQKMDEGMQKSQQQLLDAIKLTIDDDTQLIN